MTEKLQTKNMYLELPTAHNEKHYTSAPFPQNNIVMDISSYETSFPHFLGDLSGSLPMGKRIFWQGVLEKAQNFRNGGENGGKRKGYDITSPS